MWTRLGSGFSVDRVVRETSFHKGELLQGLLKYNGLSVSAWLASLLRGL